MRKEVEHRGGESGIRTRENPSGLYTLSRRTCSTAPAPLRGDKKELHRQYQLLPMQRSSPSMALYEGECQRIEAAGPKQAPSL